MIRGLFGQAMLIRQGLVVTIAIPFFLMLFPSCGQEEQSGKGTVTTLGECGEITYYGVCDEDGALLWCKDGKLKRQDCPAEGKTCGTNGTSSGMFCAPPCGDVPESGRCDGNTLKWCAAGLLGDVPCEEHGGGGTGAVCTWDTENCVARCMGCGDLPEQGRCDGDVLKYCSTGAPFYTDCAAWGKHCGVDPDSGYPLCLPVEAPEPCNPLAFEGFCSASGVRFYCNNTGEVGSYDCNKLGLGCAIDPSTGEARCQGCSQADWWTEPCKWGVRHVCRDDFVYWENCDEVCDVPL